MARVAVLLGGLSPERPVSLVSGRGCADALKRLGHDVVEIDPQNPTWISELRDLRPDAVFNALHGEWGEDGRTQGVLRRSGIVLNVLAVLWLAFETINIAWPRASLAPVGAPWYQIWAAPMVVAAITVIGLLYLAIAKPHGR